MSALRERPSGRCDRRSLEGFGGQGLFLDRWNMTLGLRGLQTL
jgi:hypothetical protein